MDNIDAYLKLVELECRLYDTINDVVVNQVKEKYKNISSDRIHYTLPVIDGKSNSTPKSTTSIKNREDRLKYMRECQKNWGKPIPRGGNRK